ncbi:hypothetical protein J6590_005511 [Homalodisca vitripennis]|nr:hypothetical protein J6590_005511 [Homalodisca vitripennis]
MKGDKNKHCSLVNAVGLKPEWLYARSPVLVSKNGNDYDVTDCDAKGFEVALELYGCPFVTSRLTSPLIARLSNLQTVAGYIATALINKKHNLNVVVYVRYYCFL